MDHISSAPYLFIINEVRHWQLQYFSFSLSAVASRGQKIGKSQFTTRWFPHFRFTCATHIYKSNAKAGNIFQCKKPFLTLTTFSAWLLCKHRAGCRKHGNTIQHPNFVLQVNSCCLSMQNGPMGWHCNSIYPCCWISNCCIHLQPKVTLVWCRLQGLLCLWWRH